MKIVIVGSIVNSDKLIEVAKKLQNLGHETELPYNTRQIMKGEISLEEYTKHKEQHGDRSFRDNATEDLIKRYYKLISESDRVLIANFDKKDQKNYIGGNALIEMAFAHINEKPLYILNEIPENSYTDEILAMKPIVLHGNLEGVLK
jgi:hypothetical protein